MSVSAAQAEAFYKEVVRRRQVWAIRDEDGFPAPQTPEGRAMPFWSARSRAVKVIENVDAYNGFEPVLLALEEWRSRWLPGPSGRSELVRRACSRLRPRPPGCGAQSRGPAAWLIAASGSRG